MPTKDREMAPGLYLKLRDGAESTLKVRIFRKYLNSLPRTMLQCTLSCFHRSSKYNDDGDRTLEMAIEDYVCSLLLSRCGHALLATGNGRIASCGVGMFVSLQFWRGSGSSCSMRAIWRGFNNLDQGQGSFVADWLIDPHRNNKAGDTGGEK